MLHVILWWFKRVDLLMIQYHTYHTHTEFFWTAVLNLLSIYFAEVKTITKGFTFLIKSHANF